MNETFTKDEMINSLKNDLRAQNISNNISNFILFVSDEKDNSLKISGECEDNQMIVFLASGINALAEASGKPVHEVTLNVMSATIAFSHEQQNKKEQEGA